jgi:hypothetical protein
LVTIIVQQLTVMITLLADVITNMVTLVVALINGDWATAWQAAGGIGQAFVDAFGATLTNLQALVSTVMTAVATVVVNTLTDLGVDVPALLETLAGAWDKIWGALAGPVDAIRSGIDGVRSALESLGGWLGGFSLPNPFAGWSMPEIPGGGFPGFAMGTAFAPGGLAWVGERGPELVDLPRGARVYDAQESQQRVQGSGGLTINVPVQTANSSLDLVELAHRVAGVILSQGAASW